MSYRVQGLNNRADGHHEPIKFKLFNNSIRPHSEHMGYVGVVTTRPVQRKS